MRFAALTVVAVFGCSAGVGCARTEKFDVRVRNDARTPLTLALTKDGPPYERLWASPEELAIESPRADEQHGYVVLPPGKDADVSISGKFDGNTRGYLRAYRGDLQISDMTAVGPTSPNRVTVPLRPGANRVIIAEQEGRLVAKPESAAPATNP